MPRFFVAQKLLFAQFQSGRLSPSALLRSSSEPPIFPSFLECAARLHVELCRTVGYHRRGVIADLFSARLELPKGNVTQVGYF